CLTGNDLDGKPQGVLQAGEQLPGIAGNAQGVGGNRAHPVGVEALDTLGEALERLDGPLNGFVIQGVVRAQPGGQSDVLLETVDRVDLGNAIQLYDPSDGKSEAVGPEVD